MTLTPNMFPMLQAASWETFYMVSVSSLLTALFGIPLGVVLVATRKGHILGRIWPVNAVLGAIINATRSVPFIIFVVAIIPLTKFLVGSSIGPTAVIVPLTLAAIVFMARLAESAILEVPHGVIEAAQSAGATSWQIIWHVLLPEARPGLIQAVTITVINLIGYSAMAGAVGGGGLGDLGIRYGYQRYMWDVMLATVLILMVWVQVIQSLGDFLSKKFRR
ncbi:methionine ABC transporter permease [Deltaproteobacteria bacterium Smac51]|nr:methionine ABC transporter permease [Deltaproteobacteria bacterium Smac51]